MESDDSDFREGPSFHSLKQEKRVKFETPVRKDNKKSGTKNTYFKMKENKYLVRKKVENHQLGDSKLKSKTEHSKHVIGKEKSGLIETVKLGEKDQGEVENVSKVVKKKGQSSLHKKPLADKTSLAIRVENMVKLVKRDVDSYFSESSLDDSNEDPDYAAAETTGSSNDEGISKNHKKKRLKKSKLKKLKNINNIGKGNVHSSEQQESGGATIAAMDACDIDDETSSFMKPDKSPPTTLPVTCPPTTLPVTCTSPTTSQPDLSIEESQEQACSFTCNSCGKVYVQMGSLVKHMKVCKKRYICLKCNKKFKKKKYLKIHVKSQHKECNTYTCDKCKLKFKTRRKLNSHEKSAHPIVKVKCSICQREFKNKSTLYVHKNKCHKNSKSVKKTWPCKMCPKTFQSDRGLRYHKLHHKNLEQYKEVSEGEDQSPETGLLR